MLKSNINSEGSGRTGAKRSARPSGRSGAARRCRRAMASLGAFVFSLGLLLPGLSAQAATSQSTDSFSDIIEICTHGTNPVSGVVDLLLARGWRTVEPLSDPSFIEPFGHSLYILGQFDPVIPPPDYDLKQAYMPDEGEILARLSDLQSQDKISLLRTGEGSTIAFLMVANKLRGQHALICRFWGQSTSTIQAYLRALSEWKGQGVLVHNNIVKETSFTFLGRPVSSRVNGLAWFFTAIGLLEDKPTFEPQVGAGHSIITVLELDFEEFQHRIGRKPAVTFVVNIERKQQVPSKTVVNRKNTDELQ